MKEILENIYDSGKAGLLSIQANTMRAEEEETFKGYCIHNSIEHMRFSYFSDYKNEFAVTPSPRNHPLEEAHSAAKELWKKSYASALDINL